MKIDQTLKISKVFLIREDCLPGISSAGDVINCSFKFYPSWSGHVANIVCPLLYGKPRFNPFKYCVFLYFFNCSSYKTGFKSTLLSGIVHILFLMLHRFDTLTAHPKL